MDIRSDFNQLDYAPRVCRISRAYEACARLLRSRSSLTKACGGEPPSVCAYTRLTARCLTVIGTTTTSTGGGSAPSAIHSADSTGLAGDGGGPTNGVLPSCA